MELPLEAKTHTTITMKGSLRNPRIGKCRYEVSAAVGSQEDRMGEEQKPIAAHPTRNVWGVEVRWQAALVYWPNWSE